MRSMYIFHNYRYYELNIWIVLLKQLKFFITDKDKAFQGPSLFKPSYSPFFNNFLQSNQVKRSRR